MITGALLDADFTSEIHNVSKGNRVVEMKYFYRFIPVDFTQSELNSFRKEINKITKSSNPNTVIDDFIKIGAVTSTFLNHGNDPEQERSKRACYIYWIGVECEWGSGIFGVEAKANQSGVRISLRYRKISWTRDFRWRKKKDK